MCGRSVLALGSSFLEGLANLEFHNLAGRNGYVLGRILRIATDLGLHFLNGESAKVTQHDAVALAQRGGDDVNSLLDNLKDVALSKIAVKLDADLVNQFSFGDRVSHNGIAFNE